MDPLPQHGLSGSEKDKRAAWPPEVYKEGPYSNLLLSSHPLRGREEGASTRVTRLCYV